MQNLKKNLLLVNFNASSGKSEICTLICYFCRKYIMFEPKLYRGVMYYNTEEGYKIEEELTFVLKNNMRNLAKFDLTLSPKICTFMGSF